MPDSLSKYIVNTWYKYWDTASDHLITEFVTFNIYKNFKYCSDLFISLITSV